MEYTGFKKVNFSDEELGNFYQDMEAAANQLELVENQYLILEQDGKTIDKYCYRDNKLVKINYTNFNSVYGGKLKPRNIEQELAFELLKNKNIPVKLITGTWGSGKTMSLVAAAMEALEKG